jgi:putative inorganic carbon (HCO3(-)) transporter
VLIGGRGSLRQGGSCMFNKSVNLFAAFIACIVPLIIVPGAKDFYYTPKITAVYLAILAVMVIWLFSGRRMDKKRAIVRNKAEMLIGVYAFLIVISTIFSIDKEKAFFGAPFRKEGAMALISYIIIFFIISYGYEIKEKHLKYLIASAVIISAYGIVQYFGYNLIKPDMFRKDWVAHSYSTIGNRNFLGSYLTLVLPLSIFAAVYKKSLIYGFTSCILYFCLLCTLTRSAWLAFIVYYSLIIAVALFKRMNLKYLTGLTIILITMSFIFNHYTGGTIFSRFTSIKQDVQSAVKTLNDDSGSKRMFIWKRGITLIAERPLLGSGPDTFQDVFMGKYSDQVNKAYGNIVFDKAHNEYLQNTITLGIPAVAVYISFLAVTLYYGIKTGRNNILLVPVLLSIIGYAVQAFFNISVVSVAPLYWIMLGVLNNLNNKAIK